MSQYWNVVHQRAWKAATKAAGLETRDRAIMVVAVQAVIAATIFFTISNADLLSRTLAASLPFLFVPIWYVVKLPAVPPMIAAELEVERDEAKAQIEVLRTLKAKRDQLGFYQGGFKVADVDSAEVLESDGRVHFGLISHWGKFDTMDRFEFREWVLELWTPFPSGPEYTSASISGAAGRIVAHRPELS